MRISALRATGLILIGISLTATACSSGPAQEPATASGTSGTPSSTAGATASATGTPTPAPSISGQISSAVSASATATPKAAATSPATPKTTAAPGIPGWTQVYHEDFSGSSLPSGWVAYNGPVTSTPGANWSNSQVSVSRGAMHLVTSSVRGQWFSGGVMNGVQAQRTYGKYEVRFRIQKAPGVMYALLLWPKSERWPIDGEVDFAEDRGGSRGTSTAALHWGTLDAHRIARKDKQADFSQWHTAGVEWSPGKVVFTMDGKDYQNLATVHAPKTAMNLAMQTVANQTCGAYQSCISSSTPASTSLDVDWVTVYARS